MTPRVQLTFAPTLGVDPVVTCLDMAHSAWTGRSSGPPSPSRARRYAQSITFDDVFQLETIEGVNWWHGYVKVYFLDPWDGVNLES